MKKTETAEVTKREVGERIDVICTLEPTTVKSLGDGVFEATITTPEIDRQNEVLVTSGIDVTTWEKTGMPVLYGHDYSGLPIGKGLSYKTFKTKMTARFQLAVEEYPFAATVAAMIKGGYLNAVSIGGLVREWSDDYRSVLKMEMVEFSVVPIPANPSALITSRSLKEITGKSVETIREEFAEFSHKVFVDKLADIPDDEVKDAVKVLKNLTARLEESVNDPSLTDDKDKKIVRHYVLRDAKAVAEQSQKVIKTIKLKV